MKKIEVIIPCFNEEKGIGHVIDELLNAQLRKKGYEVRVLVIDNNCTDKTAEIARKKGARVIEEKKRGKGNALRTGFKNLRKDTDFVVMLDGDNTYKAYEIPRLIEPIESGFCDVIVGSRLEGKVKGSSLTLSHRAANWFFTFLTRQFYGANVTDTCTGFFAWKREVIDKLNGHIVSPGFAIEAEMISKMAKLGYKIYSVPITYEPRKGNSKLSPLGDGIKITWMLLRNIRWKPKNH